MRLITGIAFASISFMPAFAQQPQTQSTPMEQALGSKLMEEINSNIQLRTQMVDLQNQIKDLKAKLPPDKPPEKK